MVAAPQVPAIIPSWDSVSLAGVRVFGGAAMISVNEPIIALSFRGASHSAVLKASKWLLQHLAMLILHTFIFWAIRLAPWSCMMAHDPATIVALRSRAAKGLVHGIPSFQALGEP